MNNGVAVKGSAEIAARWEQRSAAKRQKRPDRLGLRYGAPERNRIDFLKARDGAPGAWIGAFTPSPFLAVLFLAVGTGAIFEVVYEIGKLIQKDTARRPMPMTVFGGVLTGMLVLWVTGLLIK